MSLEFDEAQQVRLKDQVHVQVMDAAQLITREVEHHLTPELRDRFQHVRETE